jgi:hypothetical protein
MTDEIQVRRIIWGALLTGQLIFFIVTLVIPHGPAQPHLVRLLVPMAYGLVIVCAGISLSMPMLMRRAAGNAAVERPMRIAQMALLEGPSLFSIVGYLLTSERVILGAFAIAFLLLVSLFPRRPQG